MSNRVETAADARVRECVDLHISFSLIAGAGSGKTSSLIDALKRIREREGPELRQNDQHIACITFTKRAVEVIKSRLGFDELYLVSTIHSFLWYEIGRFQEDICRALYSSRLPALIDSARRRDNGSNSRTARDARAKAEALTQQRENLAAVQIFKYRDSNFSDYADGRLSHDDVLHVAALLLETNTTFRRVVGLRFPYIFVDEAQDTFEGILNGLNLVSGGDTLPMVGYFGDPWQQIYEGGTGAFSAPNAEPITKTENFRCSESVIEFLNAFRQDVAQYAAGENRARTGSIEFVLVEAETPELPRNRYSEAQIDRALLQMDAAMQGWHWQDDIDVIKLFLVRQMIARRMGFSDLNRLFTGDFASSRAQDDFEAGNHFLLLPMTATILPLVNAYAVGDERTIIEILRRDSPAFAVDGPNAEQSLKAMLDISNALVAELSNHWTDRTIGEIIRFCAEKQIVQPSERLREHLAREPRTEQYDAEVHEIDKGDWLADALFRMDASQVAPYAEFISGASAFSTQHGVKGEQYRKVLVVYDDAEASWNQFSFSKLLTPLSAGEPTDGQRERGRKLAYVSFSRAMEDLRVLLFTPDPSAARTELLERRLLRPEQIRVML